MKNDGLPACGHHSPDADGPPDGELVCSECGPTIENPAGRSEKSDRAVALKKVRPPGVALIVVGGLWAVAGLACVVLALVLVEHTRGPTGVNPGVAMAVLAVAAVIMLSLIAVGAVIAHGGIHLFHLRTRQRVVDGASTAIFFGIAGFCMLLCGGGLVVLAIPLASGIPVGIWALVVLNDPLVKATFSETLRQD